MSSLKAVVIASFPEKTDLFQSLLVTPVATANSSPPWPGQIPPPADVAERRDATRSMDTWQLAQPLPAGASSCRQTSASAVVHWPVE